MRETCFTNTKISTKSFNYSTLMCIIRTRVYILHAGNFWSRNLKKELFGSILTNFEFSVISRTTLAFWSHAVISYTCVLIIWVPLGITAYITKYSFGVYRNCSDSPMYNSSSCYSFFVPCPYVISMKIVLMNIHLYFMNLLKGQINISQYRINNKSISFGYS